MKTLENEKATASLTSLGWVINWKWQENCHMRDNTILGDVSEDEVRLWMEEN